jgi:hypothetical protein
MRLALQIESGGSQLMAESPGQEVGGRFYLRKSIVVLDELAAHRRDDLTKGLDWNAKITGEAIRSERCEKWHVHAVGCADDSIFSHMGASAGSIADEFAQAGVTFYPAKKADRISGWQKMKRLLGVPENPMSLGCMYREAASIFGQLFRTLPAISDA